MGLFGTSKKKNVRSSDLMMMTTTNNTTTTTPAAAAAAATGYSTIVTTPTTTTVPKMEYTKNTENNMLLSNQPTTATAEIGTDNNNNNNKNSNSNSNSSRRSSGVRSNNRLLRRFSSSGSVHGSSPNHGIVTFEHLPDLILDLDTAVQTSADRPNKALRMLFALSEHTGNNNNANNNSNNEPSDQNRIQMVSALNQDNAGRSLVPTLLNFLKRCEPNTNEHTLTLLVLNNISIPQANKRMIAIDHDGAKILAKLLCEDPSCHLLAIVLVNLTFTGAEIRKELISPSSSAALVESLSFALRIASLTKDEYESRIATIELEQEMHTPVHRLSILMAEDQRLRQQEEDIQGNIIPSSSILVPEQHLFPETARWCLAAIRNLTRPCNDAAAAHILIRSGTYSLILQYITVESSHSIVGNVDNSPYTWSSNSIQDAALSIVMNLAASTASREYINEDSYYQDTFSNDRIPSDLGKRKT